MLTTWRITTRALCGTVSMPASVLSKPANGNASAYPFGTEEQDKAHPGRWPT